MPRLPLNLALILGTLGLAACGEDSSPTQPGTAGDQAPATPSFAVASNSWTAKAPLPYGPTGVATGMVYDAAGQSVVYEFGGRIDGGTGFGIQAYSMATNTWTAKTATVYVFNANGVGKLGSRLYFSGGYDYGSGSPFMLGQTWAYDYGSDRLIRKADMPRPTADGVTGVINNKLYVLSGTCNDDTPPVFDCEVDSVRRTLYRYDPVANAWTILGSAPRSHVNAAGGVINGKFYVAGGANDFGQATAALDVYDPATKTWKSLAPLPTAGTFASGTVLQNKLFVVSGSYVDGRANLHTYVYDPLANTWKTKSSPPTGGALAGVALNGKSYVLSVGGSGSCCDSETASQLYTP